MSSAPTSPHARRKLTPGRPRGTVLPAAELADRNGQVQIPLRLPAALAASLDAFPELTRAAHVRAAVSQALEARAVPELLHEIAWGPFAQVRLPREMLERVEQAYGVEDREAAIVTAVAAYVSSRARRKP